MTRQEQEVIKDIISLYFSYQQKADAMHVAINESPNPDNATRSKAFRADPMAHKAHIMEKVEDVTHDEWQAKSILWTLELSERICVCAWDQIKNSINKGSGDRYRKADIVPYLRKQGLTFNQECYEVMRDIGQVKLLCEHKRRNPAFWKKAS